MVGNYVLVSFFSEVSSLFSSRLFFLSSVLLSYSFFVYLFHTVLLPLPVSSEHGVSLDLSLPSFLRNPPRRCCSNYSNRSRQSHTTTSISCLSFLHCPSPFLYLCHFNLQESSILPLPFISQSTFPCTSTPSGLVQLYEGHEHLRCRNKVFNPSVRHSPRDHRNPTLFEFSLPA